MGDYIIRNAQIINEGRIVSQDVLIRNQRIEQQWIGPLGVARNQIPG